MVTQTGRAMCSFTIDLLEKPFESTSRTLFHRQAEGLSEVFMQVLLRCRAMLLLLLTSAMPRTYLRQTPIPNLTSLFSKPMNGLRLHWEQPPEREWLEPRPVSF